MRKVRSYDELFPERFIKSETFGDKIVGLTIKAVGVDTIEDGDETEDVRIIQFNETEKELSLNVTNGQLIKGMFGEVSDWIGKRIFLHAIPFSSPMFPDAKTATRVYGSPDLENDTKVTIKPNHKQSAKIMIMKNKK